MSRRILTPTRAAPMALVAASSLVACASQPEPRPTGLSPAVMNAIERVEQRRAAEARVPEDPSAGAASEGGSQRGASMRGADAQGATGPQATGGQGSGGQGSGGQGVGSQGVGSQGAAGQAAEASDLVTIVRVNTEGLTVDVSGLEVEFLLSTAATADLIARLAESGGMTVTTGQVELRSSGASAADGPMVLRDGSVASEDPSIRNANGRAGGTRRRR